MRLTPAVGAASFHVLSTQHAIHLVRASLCACFLAIFLGGSPHAEAQTDPNLEQGIKPYGAYDAADIDRVNLSSGALSLEMPLYTYPQLGGKLRFGFELLAGSPGFAEHTTCAPPPGKCTTSWTGTGGSVGIAAVSNPTVTIARAYEAPNNTPYYTPSIIESDGGTHKLALLSGSQWRSTDATGYLYNGSTGILTDKDGIATQVGTITQVGTAWPTVRKDPDGNEITFSLSSGWTDTMGRKFPYPIPSTSNFGGCTGTLTVTSATLWTIPGPSGGTLNLKFCYAEVPLKFGTINTTESVLQSVVLPDGLAWTFSYVTTGSAALSGIAFPTGGTITYGYSTLSLCPQTSPSGYRETVASRTVNAQDGSGPHTWTYSYNFTEGSPNTLVTTVTDPLGNQSVHTSAGQGGDSCGLYETQGNFYQGTSGSANLLKTISTTYYSGPALNGGSATNVFPTQNLTAWANGQQSKTTITPDSGFTWTCINSLCTTGVLSNLGIYGLQVKKQEYDYGSGAPGGLLRTTNNSYLALSNSSYLNANLLSLLSSKQTTNSSGTQVAYTTYGYDATGSPQCACGNQTSVSGWLNTTGGYLVTNNVYDSNGRLISSTDPNGNPTTYAYSTGYAGSGPTSVTNALGQTTYHTYDFNTGLLTSTTDPNGQTQSISYDPLTLRQTEVQYPDGGQLGFCYSDTASEGCASGPPYEVIVTKKITATQNLVETGIVDGLGRLSEVELNSDPTGVDYTLFTYDADGRKATQTNPYRSTSDATYGLTTYRYDALNRTTLATKADGSTVTTSYSGSCTTVTDEAGKTRESCADGLGRMTEVIENPGGLNYVTNYTYDALNDLVSVAQGGSRNRSFAYDSLKRLTSSGNPETGGTAAPVTYTYDADNNVLTKRDARAITITYSWDKLNRMLGRTYSNGDPSVSYSYDSTACVVVSSCYNVGQMTGMTDAAGSENFAYDKMGRLWGDHRTTIAISKNSSYVYNLDGSLASLTYPSGRVLTYAYLASALPTTATDSTTGVAEVSDASYAPNGAPAFRSLNAAVGQTILYNKRLQPCWNWVGTGTTLPLSYTCTTTGPTGTTFDMKYNYNLGADNGNLVGVTNDRNSNRSQTYSYDQLNRITNAATVSTCTANCWGLAFTIDEWANLLSATATGTAIPLNLSVNTNNQITTAPFTYDADGNLTADATSSYVWNAESEIETGGGVSYLYDGQGNRVEKSATRLYWYGPGGEVLDETDATGSTSNAAFSEYVYFDGARVARRDYLNNVYYYFADQVNSSRVIAEVPAGTTTPTLCYDADFYPYGGEDVFTNSCPQNYKFQGKERDPETDNDYFGARFYSSTYGRFLSPDWSSVPAAVPYANLTDPQTLNLYAIVGGNPESFADLNGHDPYPGCKAPNECSDDTNTAEQNQPSVLSSAGQVAKDTVIGTAKEAANAVIDLANLINAPIDASLAKLGINFSFGQGSDLQASTPGEKGAMIGTGLGLLLVPGVGEEKAAATSGTSVYTIIKDGESAYVGITNNLARRAAEHGETLTEVASGLTRTQARGVEQALIEQHGLASNGGTLLNKINSIARSNPVYNEAVQFGKELLGAIGYH
jgi:RHS repeat-associated protein